MGATHVTNGFVRDQLEAITAAPYITAIARLTRTDLHASHDKKLVILIPNHNIKAKFKVTVVVIPVEDLSNGEPA